MSNIVIGIEGYVGAGKSAICRELLNHIPNSIILEGGNLYRAIVYSLLKSGIDLSNLKQNMSHVDIKSIMEKLKITIAIENRQTAIYIDGQKIDEEKLQINPNVDFLIITRPYARDFDIVKVRKNLLHALALAHIIEEMPDEVEEN